MAASIRWRGVVLVCLLMVGLGVGVAYSFHDIYTGSMTIIIKGNEVSNDAMIPGLKVVAYRNLVTAGALANEQKILTSPDLASKVLRDVQTRHKDVSFGVLKLKNFEALQPYVDRVENYVGSLKEKYLGTDAVSNKPMSLGSPKVAGLLKSVTITPTLNSQVIDIEMRHTDADLLLDVLQTYLRDYLKLRREIWVADQAPEFFRKRADEYWSEWRSDLSKLQKIKSGTDIITVEGEKTKLIEQLTDLEKQLDAVEFREQALAGKMKMLRTTAPEELMAIPISERPEGQSPLNDMKLKTSALAKELSDASRFFLPISSKVKNLKREYGLSLVKYRILAESYLRSQMALVANHKRQLKKKIVEHKAKNNEIDRVETEVATLQERMSIAKSNITAYELKHSETKIGNELTEQTLRNVGVIAEPALAAKPIFPNKSTLIPLAAVLGLVLGLLMAVIGELMDDSYKLPEDITKETDVPVVASYPLDKKGRIVKKRN